MGLLGNRNKHQALIIAINLEIFVLKRTLWIRTLHETM